MTLSCGIREPWDLDGADRLLSRIADGFDIVVDMIKELLGHKGDIGGWTIWEAHRVSTSLRVLAGVI